MKGYKFFIPENYVRNKDKESECQEKGNEYKKITF
jgi:hypothetical protein